MRTTFHIIQKIINIVLSSAAIKISNCNSYAEASLLCKKKNFDLIILDANLTGLNSPSELKGLCERAGNCPALILLGNYQKFSLQEYKKSGFSLFLKKPFSSEQLNNILEELGIYDEPAQTQNDIKLNKFTEKEVQQIIEKYCEKNLKKIASEVIKEEILKLEKSQDN